ncbi:MAG: sn-glycerol-3-phosphate ABC transporter ATP-binding protein UgpC [Cyanobacteria bacterium P01_A01_bin.17]
MAGIVFEQVTKRYENGFEAVKNFNLEIGEQEFLVLVGPSGCGKTTSLRMLAGLESISTGNIYINDKRVNDVASKDRDIAMVFQSYALYPHMTVFENMAFSLDLQGVSKAEQKERVQKTATQLGIEALLDRKPKQLSGGQRQRVAVGRAIVRDPAVFLMDEPLSNLDAKLRGQARTELSDLQKKLGTTFVYVTHDQVEAMTMGTRIAVMNQGILQQVDTPQTLYDSPNNIFVAGFLGSPSMNFLKAKLTAEQGQLWVVNQAVKLLLPEHLQAKYQQYQGMEVVFGLRPEHIAVSQSGTVASAIEVAAKVTALEMMGHEAMVYFTLTDGQNCIARVPPQLQLTPGDNFNAYFDMNYCHLFDLDSEHVL